MPDAIFHITTSAAWQAASSSGMPYEAASLAAEGFIHCSTPVQVPWVANGRFRGTPEPLVLLRLNPSALTSELKWESAEPDLPQFPHIYGPIDLAAVTEVSDFVEGRAGFAAPTP